MSKRLPLALALCGLILAVSAPASSPPPARRPITHNDYAGWRSVQGPVLSPDGAYLAYAAVPAEGNGEFVVRHLASGKEHRHPCGGRVAASARPGKGGKAAAGPGPHQFTPDGKCVLFPISPPRPVKGKAPAAGTALGVMDLGSGKVTRIEKVRNYQVPEEGPAAVAYLKDTGIPVPDATKGAPAKGGPRSKGPAAVPGPRVNPSELVLRNLTNGKERTFADVTEYSLTRDGKLLVYCVSSKKAEANGVFAVGVSDAAVPQPLRRGPGRFTRLTWDEDQTQVAFFHVGEPGSPAAKTAPRICHWKREPQPAPSLVMPPATAFAGLTAVAVARSAHLTPAAAELTPAGKPAFRPGFEISDAGGLSFSQDGKKVYFGLKAPPPPPPPAGTAAPGQGGANVELWHYKDEVILPMQKVRYVANRNRTYRAVFHLDGHTCRQLADDTLADVQPTLTGDLALGTDDRAYRMLVGSETFSPVVDAYLVNARTGERKLIAKKQAFPMTLSPAGKYVVSFDGKDWHSVATSGGKRVNLTAKLGVPFTNELHDMPSDAPPHGLAGWTRGDTHVLVHDRYDVWQLALDGSEARNLTGGFGRKTRTQLRIVRLDPKERFFDPSKPCLLRADCEPTRETGFYRLKPDGELKVLVIGDRYYGTPVKARKSGKLLLTVSTFHDYPDLHVADPDFREVRKVSNVNPQKSNLLWGMAELISYKNTDGEPLQAVLIKPENFDPKKKYPMLVYVYERLTQNLHRFIDPRPGTSINPSYYASNGYLVLMPDIAYTVGYPGQSALKCVLPAIQKVVDTGCVNEKAIGIQGHSWGGYQTAFMITQTTRFKAAAAGAPVVNMTSAYGGIRWGSGLPRQFQYEKTQSRIGGTLWQYPDRFRENSPLFQADRIQTPLMMLHNDRDGAVPWQQGIEYYLALRRLGKEVYLFNYTGEDHGLVQRANQRDYTVRMQQFFDHHLKGAPKPEWMAKGLPYRPAPNAGTPAGRRGPAAEE